MTLSMLSFVLSVSSFWFVTLGLQFVVPGLPFRLALSDFAVAVYFVFMLLRRRQSFTVLLRKDVLALLVLFVFSFFWGKKNLGYSTDYAFFNKFLGFGVLLISATCVYDWVIVLEQDFRFVLNLFVRATALLNLVYFLGYIPFLSVLRDVFILLPSTEARLRGLMVDPNAYGGLLAVVLIFHLADLLQEKEKPLRERFWDALTLCSLALGLFLTTSRSAYIGFIAGFVVLLLIFRSRRHIMSFFIISAGGVIGVLLSPLRGLIVARIFSLEQILSRIEIMQAGMRAFRESPIFGLGLGVFFELSQSYFGLPWKQIIHNSYLWILADMGLVGAVIWGYFLYTLLRDNLALLGYSKKQAPYLFPSVAAVFSSLVSMLVFSLGIEALYQRHLWMLVGLVLGFQAVSGENRNS